MTTINRLDVLLKAELKDLGNGVDDNEKELRIYSHGKLVITIRVINNFVDVENEMTGAVYNVLEIAESGMVINDEPKLDN